MAFYTRPRLALAASAGCLAAIPLLLGPGCPTVPPGPAGPVMGQPVVAVTSPSVSQTVAVGEAVTIVYNANSVMGAALEVAAFYDWDGILNSGDEVFFRTGLPSGDNRFVELNTTGLAVGPLHLGIAAADAVGRVGFDYADGVITLVAAPDPIFSSPAGDLTVAQGTVVPIIFDAGAGITAFTWQLFYDTDAVSNGNEFMIAQGSNTNSSSVESEFDTTGVVRDTAYFVGVTITTPDAVTGTAYAPGRVEIVAATGALVTVLSPSSSVTAVVGTPVAVRVAAVDPTSASPMVRVFYDLDQIADNGNDRLIATIEGSAGEVVWETTGVSPGTYYVGAELVDFLPLQVSYATGSVQILGSGSGAGGGGSAGGTPQLTMRSPFSKVILVQGEELAVSWTTSYTIGQATIEVWREPDVDADGLPDGPSTRIAISPVGLDASARSLTFDTTGVVGRFLFGATVTAPGEDPVEDYAAGSVTIIPAMLWVGLLRSPEPEGEIPIEPSPQSEYLRFEGAIFRGHNIGDNLGSAMLVADDYDDDGILDVVLAAQFGKPFFLAQGGRGAGEAYMIYGQRGQRYLGYYEVNMVGAGNLPGGSDALPGLIFTGIVPNPNPPNSAYGNPLGYQVDGRPPEPYSTEGLRSLLLIPDQDGDDKMEIVFGFPWCDSYSLWYQQEDGTHPAPMWALGRLENNGHFLRGGVVIVASTNALLTSRTSRSRHFDRVMMLHEVGQVFEDMRVIDTPGDDFDTPAVIDVCPRCTPDDGTEDPILGDLAVFPAEGFWQTTQGTGTSWSIDPLRLATPPIPDATYWDPRYGGGYSEFPLMIYSWAAETVGLDQVDSPPGPSSAFFVGGRLLTFSCEARYPSAGSMRVLQTGFYYSSLPYLGEASCTDLSPYRCYCPGGRIAAPLPPYGCRILGQTTTQLFTNPPTMANLFGLSISVSGDFLLIGARLRTVMKEDVTALRNDVLLGDRIESGEIYMLQLKRPGVGSSHYLWNAHREASSPAPHNYIIQDLGYNRCLAGCWSMVPTSPGDVAFEMSRPFHIVGQPYDRIGEVTGLLDINGDGVQDFAVGGAGTNGGRGAVYVIYRRHPELESDYLLERLQLAPSDLNRLNGLMIVGRPGENLGTALAGMGPRWDELNDDYNGDGFADLLVGSPNATSGGGFHAGEVFILFGGRNLLSPQGGSTIPELRDAGDGMVLAGAFAGDRAGTTVANPGDVNGDGVADILISAPDASPRFDSDGDGTLDTIGLDLNGDRLADDLDGDGTPDDMTGAGLVYLVFGGDHLTGTIGLEYIGTPSLPGVALVGYKGGDHLGGGLTQNGLLGQGLNSAGDLDGDGLDDFFIGSILADPDGKTNAGEVYLVYGFDRFPIGPR